MTRTLDHRALGLPMILIGGWMTAVPGWLWVAPWVIACGLVGGGLLTRNPVSRDLKLTMYAVLVLTALLSWGAFQQWQRGGSIDAFGAIGFAAALLLSALAASLPTESLRHGMILVRVLAGVSTLYALAQAMQGVPRALGLLSLNPNALAGFLVLVATHWMIAERGSKRSIAGALFTLAGLPFTGSRWAFLVLAFIIAALLVKRVIGVRAALLLSAVLVVASAQIVGEAGRFDNPKLQGAGLITHDSLDRFAMPITPAVEPQGFLGHQLFGKGGHNTFSRVAVEAGWIGLALYLGILVLALIRSRGAVRGALVVVLVLSLADYYVWGPFQLAPLTWALVGMGIYGQDA